MCNETVNALTSFIKASPTPFHAVASIGDILTEHGYERVLEGNVWNLEAGGKYYVTRNDSSVIAFRIGTKLNDYGFNIAASHSDSPSFKLKENAELEVRGKYTKLNTEGYGGMLCSTWFDRPLSIAGRVIVNIGGTLETKLVKIDRDLVMIPSLAIHMDRDFNTGHEYNKQIDTLPILSTAVGEDVKVKKLLAQELGVEEKTILGTDLYLYNRMEPSNWGLNREFVSCPQLDDLQCAYASLQGFLDGENEESVSVFACFDNEEVGSGTKQGAASTFLSDVLWRVNHALGKSEEDYHRAVASSFMLSCDNAHAVHPNYQDKTDVNNCAYMNEGIVIKSHAGQKYTSDGISIALFKSICDRVDVPLQYFANRSDKIGGSTLGNIAMAQVSLNAVDIGLPQLGMHSSYETTGVKDTEYLIKAATEFYNSHISITEEGNVKLNFS